MAVVSPDKRRRELGIAKEHRPGLHYYVDADTGSNSNDGKSWSSAFLTVQAGDNAAVTGDIIHIAAGDYAETVTVTGATDEIMFIGEGPRTSVSIAPTVANANAFVLDGTVASARIEECTLININCDGNGTGIGLHIKGNIRRATIIDCKLEAGDTTGTAVKLESTGAGSIGDVQIRGGEICWAQTGLSIDVTGGGDPATEIWVEGVRFHNITANHVINATATSHIIELWQCRFFPLEAGTAPTGLYVDLRAGTTVGGVNDCYFPVAIAGGKVLVDADVKVLSRFTDGFNTVAPT